MSKLASFLGLMCFVGIVAYWYFLPLQSFLALINAGNLLGPLFGNGIAFVLLFLVGIPITVVLLIVGLALLGEG
jgi:hypothetical protein